MGQTIALCLNKAPSCGAKAGLNAKINAAAVCTGKHDAATWAALAAPGVGVFPGLLEFVATLR